jgi:lipopolysaccharide export LptBFGC system permease protein LptF
MLAPGLILAVALALIMFGLQSFLTAYRRKFANEMIKAATLMVMGLFLIYFWTTISGIPASGGYNTRPGY